jgi:hypothetical protein
MSRFYNYIFIFLLIVASACATSTKATKTTTENKEAEASIVIAEDLSNYRPRYSISDVATTPATRSNPANHVNNKVEALMDTIASVNKNIKYAQGYRILAYNGSERQTVMDLRKSILKRVPEEKDYLTYQQPNFKLKIGDFFTRIEAQQVLNKIQDLLPNALIVQEQITINKSVNR